jgi:hypothetical protein
VKAALSNSIYEHNTLTLAKKQFMWQEDIGPMGVIIHIHRLVISIKIDTEYERAAETYVFRTGDVVFK